MEDLADGRWLDDHHHARGSNKAVDEDEGEDKNGADISPNKMFSFEMAVKQAVKRDKAAESSLFGSEKRVKETAERTKDPLSPDALLGALGGGEAEVKRIVEDGDDEGTLQTRRDGTKPSQADLTKRSVDPIMEAQQAGNELSYESGYDDEVALKRRLREARLQYSKATAQGLTDNKLAYVNLKAEAPKKVAVKKKKETHKDVARMTIRELSSAMLEGGGHPVKYLKGLAKHEAQQARTPNKTNACHCAVRDNFKSRPFRRISRYACKHGFCYLPPGHAGKVCAQARISHYSDSGIPVYWSRVACGNRHG